MCTASNRRVYQYIIKGGLWCLIANMCNPKLWSTACTHVVAVTKAEHSFALFFAYFEVHENMSITRV